MIHGAVSTNQVWDSIYESFLPYGDVILLNIIGHAPSEVNWEKVKNLEIFSKIQTDVINEIIEKHYKNQNKKITLMGHSVGGGIALFSSFLQPEKFHAAIALTPVVTLDLGNLSPLNIYANFLTKVKIQEGVIWKTQFDVLKYIIENHFDFFYGMLQIVGTHKKDFVNNEKKYVEDFCKMILTQEHSSIQYVSNIFEDAINNKENSYYSIYRKFLNNEIKTTSKRLVFGATNDILINVEQHRLAAKATDAKYIELENCGHFCTVDDPEKIIQDIKVFLDLT